MSTTAPAHDLIDDARLSAWLDSQGLEPGQPLSHELLTGGRSNVMFTVRRGESTWVLRRPAKVAIERADEGMRREYRILAALAGTDVPHPAVVALCDDHSVLGCTFYLMPRVDGVGPFPPPDGFDTPSGRAAIAYGLVDALAALHRVDWKAAGLGDLGRPEGFHQRQVSRWGKQLASYEGREMPGADRVMAWLEEHAPLEYDPVLMHADYHMMNVLVDQQNPGKVVAILDWETATIGDPLLDLAGFTEIWCSVTAGGAWPSREQLVEHYRIARGLDQIASLTYYETLYNFRLAVLLEGIFQRSLRDSTRADDHEMGKRALFNLNRALELVEGAA